MRVKNKQQSVHPKRDEVFAPTKTLSQSDSAVLVGTLVWAKHSHFPWWPGLVVSNNDVGWPAYLKKKFTHCILWLGPNKTASVIPVHKISDFLDPNLITLMNQPTKEGGNELDNAILEALRGLVSKKISDENELDDISVRKLKALAVQTRIEAELICGRKQVVVDTTSCWFKRTIASLKSSDKSFKTVSCKKGKTRLPRAINLQKRMIISSSNSQEEGSTSSSSTLSAEMSLPAMDYFDSLPKKIDEEEGDEPPSRKKKAFNEPKVDGMSLMQKFLQDELFRRLEMTRASDDDLDLAIYQPADEQKVHVEECKHHEAVLVTVPAFPVPALQKPTRAGKRVVSETDVPILIKHLHGSHSIDSTVDEFIGHLERTRPQEKIVPSKIQIKDKIRKIGTWNKKSSTWMVPPKLSKPILPDTSIEKEVPLNPDGAPSQPTNTGTPTILPETTCSIQLQLHELKSPLTYVLSSMSCSPLSSVSGCEINNDSSGEKKKQNKKSKAARKNQDQQVKKLPEKKKKLYLTFDAQIDLVRQVLAEKLSEPKAVSVKN